MTGPSVSKLDPSLSSVWPTRVVIPHGAAAGLLLLLDPVLVAQVMATPADHPGAAMLQSAINALERAAQLSAHDERNEP